VLSVLTDRSVLLSLRMYGADDGQVKSFVIGQ
jgi:hypothetical protein